MGMMAGVMSSWWLEFWLVRRVGAAIGPVGDQAGGRKDHGGSGGGMVTEATLVQRSRGVKAVSQRRISPCTETARTQK